MKKKLVAILLGITFLMSSLTAYADEPVQKDYTSYIEEVAADYSICPELIEAICEKESHWNEKAINKAGTCKGLMQINPKWQKARMEKLEITDLYDGEQNIRLGIDYIAELFDTYGDVYAVLMAYNEGTNGPKRYKKGIVSSYAKGIVSRSEELEKEHGKVN